MSTKIDRRAADTDHTGHLMWIALQEHLSTLPSEDTRLVIADMIECWTNPAISAVRANDLDRYISRYIGTVLRYSIGAEARGRWRDHIHSIRTMDDDPSSANTPITRRCGTSDIGNLLRVHPRIVAGHQARGDLPPTAQAGTANWWTPAEIDTYTAGYNRDLARPCRLAIPISGHTGPQRPLTLDLTPQGVKNGEWDITLRAGDDQVIRLQLKVDSLDPRHVTTAAIDWLLDLPESPGNCVYRGIQTSQTSDGPVVTELAHDVAELDAARKALTWGERYSLNFWRDERTDHGTRTWQLDRVTLA